jgi:hypothetical protein
MITVIKLANNEIPNLDDVLSIIKSGLFYINFTY